MEDDEVVEGELREEVLAFLFAVGAGGSVRERVRLLGLDPADSGMAEVL